MKNSNKEVDIMQNKKQNSNKFFNISVVAVLVATLATASLMTGCFSNGEADETNPTRVVNETQIVTKVINGVLTDEEGNILKDENGEPMTAPSGTPDSNEAEKNENDVVNKTPNGDSDNKTSNNGSDNKTSNNGSDNKTPNKSDTSSKTSDSKTPSKSDSTSKPSDKKPSNNDSNKPNNDSGTLKLGGKTFNVGDTVTCTYKVSSADYFINYQGYVEYDNTVLKATNAKLLGKASSGGVLNYKLADKVRFNGIKLSGYDYTEGGDFLEVTYEVIGSGSTSPFLVWEVVTDEDMNKMVINGEVKSTFKVKESYK